MSAAERVEVPVVGARSPEIERLVETVRAGVAAASPSPGARGRGRRTRRKDRPEKLPADAALQSDALARVVVVNALAGEGEIAPGVVTELVRTAREEQPQRSVVVVLDEGSPEAVRAALDAGAHEFLGRDVLGNEEAVIWRLRNAVRRAPGGHVEEPDPVVATEARPLTVGRGTRLTEEAVRSAEAAIETAVTTLPRPAEGWHHGPGLLEIVAPTLRDPDSGRLDARRIAQATGLSLAALARAAGVSQQALSATPDSPGAQAGLVPIARLTDLLDEMFEQEHKRVWLQTPHPRFGGRSPAQAVEAGDADLVALSVERALEGLPD